MCAHFKKKKLEERKLEKKYSEKIKKIIK